MQDDKMQAAEKVLQGFDFDHPFRVDNDGAIQNDVIGIYAPEVYDEEVSPADTWEPITGYSGQDQYPGPVMHNSEYLGGGMLRDLLERPGIYVQVPCYWPAEEDEDNIEGWMLLRHAFS